MGLRYKSRDWLRVEVHIWLGTHGHQSCLTIKSRAMMPECCEFVGFTITYLPPTSIAIKDCFHPSAVAGPQVPRDAGCKPRIVHFTIPYAMSIGFYLKLRISTDRITDAFAMLKPGRHNTPSFVEQQAACSALPQGYPTDTLFMNNSSLQTCLFVITCITSLFGTHSLHSVTRADCRCSPV